MLLISESRESASRRRRWAAALQEADSEWILGVVITLELTTVFEI